MAPKRGWCKHCLDDYRHGDIIVRCSSCPRTFHKECLDHDLLTNTTASSYYQNNDDLLDLTDFTCDSCQQYAQESEIVNDERCKICKERNRDESDVLLLCDGCPNSYHMSCLDLQVEPDSDKWFCPMCKPEAFQGVNVRMQRRNPLMDTSEHVNSSICYVCQRHGKLLGCDFCSNSFHYDCLPEFDIDTIADVWECPCCRGEDPFINQMHKRWTISQIEKNSKTRRKCMLTWKGVITRYRNRFILAHRTELSPFVTPKIMDQLMRSFISSKNKNKKDKIKDVENQLQLLQEEQLVESNKFVIKARKSIYYPSGRKKDNRPMRAGVALKPHQEDGVDWLLKSFLTGGAILADEMGLGKTIQTLCFLSYLKMMNIEGPHLIVVPLSTVGNWLREIHRFTPHLTVIKICGSKTERHHAMSDRLAYSGLYDLFVTTYETVKCEEGFFVETIPRWQCLILDEAHRIKNQSGALRHSMDRIVSNMRLLLTGTPLQNNAQELFTLINFMFPDLFRDSEIMEQAFSNKKKRNPDDEVDFTNEELDAIKLLLSQIMLRRLKEQAISLPKKIFHDVWLPLSQETLKWYRTLMNIKSLMRENVSIKKLLGVVIKMRIVCGHPRGIVSRTQQMEKLFEFFKQEEVGFQEKMESEANDLKNIKGIAHIHASAKLTFLDKLLCQLHYENCRLVPNYMRVYTQHLRSLDQSLFRQFSTAHKNAASASESGVGEEGSAPPAESQSVGGGSKLDLLEALKAPNMKLELVAGLLKTEPKPEPELKVPVKTEPEHRNAESAENYAADQEKMDLDKAEPDNADAEAEEKAGEGAKAVKKERKKRKRMKMTKQEVLSKVENNFVRFPENTSQSALYLSDSLRQANLSDESPYVSMRIYEKALEQEDRFKKSKKKATFKFESTNVLDSSATVEEYLTPHEQAKLDSSKNDVNKRTSKVIESDDEEEPEAPKPAKPEPAPAPVKEEKKPEMPFGSSSMDNEEEAVKGGKGDEGAMKMHKVLVFTQFQLVLDELESYCVNRGWKYMRLDGSTNKLIRELDIREFNSPNSNYFVYLISTRAGGLGINLTAANHVVLYDEDWNPFIDLQAIDRAHRIGQKRNVHIWKLISEWTVEERMALIREKKLQLDKLILHSKQGVDAGEAAAPPPQRPQPKSESDSDSEIAPDENIYEQNALKKNELDEDDVVISLSHAAILRMMMHGNKALQYLESEVIVDMKLNEIVDRKRRVPPEDLDDAQDVTDDIMISRGDDTGGEDRVIIELVKEDEEDEERKSRKLKGVLMEDVMDEMGLAGDSKPAPPPEGFEADEDAMELDGAEHGGAEPEVPPLGEPSDGLEKSKRSRMALEMEKAGLLWRSGREKKKPNLIYTPTIWHKKSEARALRHETKCFCCGKPKNFKTTYRDKDDNEVEVDYGELVKCFRCPKTYHKLCERLSAVKKTWSCRWHECCLCFRKSSQCGNLLIHCSNCPTSFCYDCFPPDYSRHYVSDEYYYSLNQRGMAANSSNWIFFLCSKCKIESERKKRSMSGEERDKHKKEQKELRSELLSTMKDREPSQRQSKKVRIMHNRREKSRVDELKAQELELERRHRDLYERLFPVNLLQELENRVSTDLLNVNRKEKADKPAKEPPAAKGEQEQEEGKGAKEEAPSRRRKSKDADGEDKGDKDDEWSAVRVRKRGLNFSNVRMPKRILQFCDNCRIPLHNVYRNPAACPYKLETVKLDLEIKVHKSKSPGEELDTLDINSFNHTIKSNTISSLASTLGAAGSSAVAPAVALSPEPPGSAAAAKEDSVAGKRDDVKVIRKAYCSNCYECKGVRSAHLRRHCEFLTEEDRKEYAQRRERVEAAMAMLEKLVPPGPNAVDYTQLNNYRLKSVYNHMLDQCDALYLRALVGTGALPKECLNAVASSLEGSGDPEDISNSTPSTANAPNPAVHDLDIKSFNSIYKLNGANKLLMPIVYNE